ncbi:hypothetical protein CL622_05605 [archaeon]|nr:hypothetical protein [archaeon]|tara:strand:+ start:400 stop:669 length:270 start_codon:yes stop_codon:yes gene_type:complete
MSAEQWEHWEKLANSRTIENKELKGKLAYCDNLSRKRLEQIKKLSRDNDALKLSLMFLEDQLLDAKNNNMSTNAENALLKQKLKGKGEH